MTSLRAEATLRDLHSARWPSARNFSASGMPKFRKFCNSCAKFLRKFYVNSTPDAHFFGSEQIFDFFKRCSNVTIFLRSESWPNTRNSFSQGALNFRKFCNSSAGFSQKFFVISMPRACFFGSVVGLHAVGANSWAPTGQ